MGLSLNSVVHAVQSGAHDLAEGIAQNMHALGDAEAHIATQLVNEARKAANRLPGGMHLGTKILGKNARGPLRPKDIAAKSCQDIHGNVLKGRRPYSILSRLNLAAGAQSATALLGDFFTTAASGQITTASRLGNEFISETAQIFVSTGLAAAFIEDAATLAGLYIKEFHADAEVARYSITDLATIVTHSGVVTSGGAAAIFAIDMPGAEFKQAYNPYTDYRMELWNTRAFTSVSPINVTLELTGTIKG